MARSRPSPTLMKAENRRLRTRLEELESTLRAILSGNVDGVVVPGSEPGTSLYRLADADAPYRVLVETMNEGALTLSTDGIIVYCNRHFATMVESPHERLVGQTFLAFVRPQDRRPVQGLLDRCTHGSTKEELILVTASGRELPVLFSYGAIDHGDSLGLNVVLTDLTERRHSEQSQLALERQLLHAQKLESLGVLAGGIAHDFNNILMAIAGHVELGMLKLPPDSDAKHHLVQIKSAGRKAADLTKQMLAYSGKGQFLIDTFDVNTLAKDLQPMLRVSVSKAIDLKVIPAPEPAWIRADAGQIDQVLMNLVINGADAIGEGPGTLTVEVSRRRDRGADWVEVSVTDTGCGMSPETRAKIFDPFFTTKFTGRGLGLAAVQGIVAAHKGTISIRSALGQGTEFRIALPAEGGPPVRAPAETAPSLGPWTGEGTILLVDDEAEVRRVSAAMVEALGFSVVAVDSGAEAERQVRTRTDLRAVVLDLVLPGVPGREVLATIRTLRPGLPVLLASGHCDESVAAEGGPTASLQKPFDLEGLRLALKDLLASG